MLGIFLDLSLPYNSFIFHFFIFWDFGVIKSFPFPFLPLNLPYTPPCWLSNSWPIFSLIVVICVCVPKYIKTTHTFCIMLLICMYSFETVSHWTWTCQPASQQELPVSAFLVLRRPSCPDVHMGAGTQFLMLVRQALHWLRPIVFPPPNKALREHNLLHLLRVTKTQEKPGPSRRRSRAGGLALPAMESYYWAGVIKTVIFIQG